MEQPKGTFRFAPINEKPIMIPKTEDLQSFYNALDETRYRLAFLLYATTEFRRNEVLTLRIEDIDLSVLSRRMTLRRILKAVGDLLEPFPQAS